MGQNAEDIIDGSACQLCGCYFEVGPFIYTHGFPVVCHDCWKDLTEQERKSYIEADTITH